MEYVLLVFVLLLLAAVITLKILHRVTVFEYQRGLLYRWGKFVEVLQPGMHYYFRPFQAIHLVDIRTVNVTLPGQEVLTADNISIKISLAASYRITDPYLVVNRVVNYQEALYLLLQLALRDVIGGLEVDDLLSRRAGIGQTIFENTASKAAELGLELLLVNIKDIMFPGELKNIFAQVVNARKEGLAALERARGESAALRNLANTARLLDNNPSLRQLRLFQVLEKGTGNTIVVIPPDGAAVNRLLGEAAPVGDE